FALLLTRFAGYDFDAPDGFAITVPLAATDLARPHDLAQPCSNVVIGHLSGLFFGYVGRYFLTGKQRLHLLDYVMRLKRLAVILQDLVIDRHTRFRPQVPSELPGVVSFDTDGLLAFAQDPGCLLRVERRQVLEVKLIGLNPLGSQQRDRL